MRPYALLLSVATLLATPAALAQTAIPLAEELARSREKGSAPSDADGVHFKSAFVAHDEARARPEGFFPELLLDVGRIPDEKPAKDRMSVAVHGEYQLRFRAFSTLPLTQPIRATGDEASNLGQNYHLYHWMRFRPVFRYDEKLEIRGELDFPRGFVAGPRTVRVDAARDDFSEREWYGVRPRQLYLQYLTPIGMVRIGHQTSHWGMGLLANDGDHPTLFGDYRRGTVVERLLFATRPGGKNSSLLIAFAGDVVYDDPLAQLQEGDRALQAVAAIRYERPNWNLGVYGVIRHQERDTSSTGPATPFTEELSVGVGDIAGSFNAPIPGFGYLFGAMEAVIVQGSTTYARNVDLTASGDEEDVLTFGGAAQLGVVIEAESDKGRRFGRLVATAEYGYASGDADPYDGTTRRFSFDQNKNVGLVLFDHVLAWKTARAATIAADPDVVARAAPGLDLFATEGAISGASYVNPTVVVRPWHWLDLKAGAVIAQTTADFVSPFQAGALGNYANYEGGNDANHDLGVELDAGVDIRLPVSNQLVVNAGADGGVLLPGSAFDDAEGNGLPTQYLLNSKFGINY